MNEQHIYQKEEIKWTTKNEYVDIDTGEKITYEEAKEKYIIIKKIKKSNVYKSTGTTTITNECRTTKQLKLKL